MNEKQYNEFKAEKACLGVAGVANLANQAPRTLLYGYNTDRTTFHVYIDPKDGLIHVFQYVPTGRVGEERIFVLSHTKGPTGGLDRNEGYVPNKRLYPESCDLEFCRLLRDADVSLPFTTYDAQGLSRVDRHNGFAGHIFHEDMAQAVELKKHQDIDFGMFSEPNIAELVVRTACIDQGVDYISIGYPEVTLVADSDIEKIREKVREYAQTCSTAATFDVDDLESDITEKSVKWGGYSNHSNHYAERHGAYAIHIDYEDCAELIEGPDVTVYEGEDGVRALQGVYHDRPYFVILRNRQDSRILVQLVGPPGQFVANTLKAYKLTPKKVAA